MWRAVEFFSGIGAFTAGVAGLPVRVVAAYDQSAAANRTYLANHGLAPCARNLDGIRPEEVPDADLWWMSPPCTPFSRRGGRKDDEDPRAASFLNLIQVLRVKRPRAVIVENVQGFVASRVHVRLLVALNEAGYAVRELDLNPFTMGVPMLRPRRFVVARHGRLPGYAPESAPRRFDPPLSAYLDPDPAPALRVPDDVVARYGRAFNVVEPANPGAYVICVTSGYRRSMKASGSYLRLADGGVRMLSPDELVRLMGFPRGVVWPGDVPVSTRYRLAGNTVDVRAVRWLVGPLVH